QGFQGNMTENYSNVSVSSSSSLSSSILAEEENLQFDNKLGKRLSHLDSIRVITSFTSLIGSLTLVMYAVNARGNPTVWLSSLRFSLFSKISTRLGMVPLGYLKLHCCGVTVYISVATCFDITYYYYYSFNIATHTPRVNGEIPNVNDATLDHERLSERLVTYGLAELQMEGDGNCQFRALADQLFRNPEYHKHVRKAVIKQLKKFRKLYEGYVPMKYKIYLKKMKKSGEWGDHVTLQAAADRFDAKICLVTSFRDTCYIEILPKDNNHNKELWLSFWCEVHYNSLYACGDLPSRTPRRKHWLF
ncbi:OTU domain-containing protein-like protein, partial [Cucurbita argyrosperma subsp. argyrosperma]